MKKYKKAKIKNKRRKFKQFDFLAYLVFYFSNVYSFHYLNFITKIRKQNTQSCTIQNDTEIEMGSRAK